MKLLDVLAKEMKEWPDGMFYAVQDYDGEVKFGSKSSECHASIDGGVWFRGNDGNEVTMLFNKVSCDYKASKVTKGQWVDAKELLTKQHATQSKHKHADMISLCAEFAQTMEDPMSMFQHWWEEDGWQDFNKDASIAFYNHREYRLKPKPLPKLNVDDKVLVWDDGDTNKCKRYFSHFDGSKVACFDSGCTSFSALHRYRVIYWDNFELYTGDDK